MGQSMLAMFKVVVMIATLLISILGALYVLDFFSDSQMRDLVEKVIKLAGIFVGAGAVMVLLYGKRE